MDTVFLREIRLETTIGVTAWERQVRQTLLLDLDLGTDTRPAAESDDIQAAVDYAAVARFVQALAAEGECQLLETLAEHIADELRTQFGLPWVRLRLSKSGILPQCRTVGICIERGEQP
ncbi:dihydroneopterin aldolase [Alkalispirillum mobile]|uniref:7,8-dihydroneopterin aldolase n=1 Tax=Alkalispirillum mobile TaxID=85925 RepID=A0A498BZN6_9GAMM|nr:dihydroneopterin aldolase [Alkalispirillum mobile]RLK48219.1 dihydroneopterin aldolase [Alkalispirillum mobile]